MFRTVRRFYEWELAASPATCSDEERRLLGVCPYKRITLISAARVAARGAETAATLVTLTIDSEVDSFQRSVARAFNAPCLTPLHSLKDVSRPEDSRKKRPNDKDI